jgi:hypothetical protein
MVIMQSSQSCTQLIKPRGFTFACCCCGKACLHPPHQLTDHDRHDQKDDKDDHIRWTVNCKCVIGFDKKIIECQKGYQRAGDARTEPQISGDQAKRDQIQKGYQSRIQCFPQGNQNYRDKGDEPKGQKILK